MASLTRKPLPSHLCPLTLRPPVPSHPPSASLFQFENVDTEIHGKNPMSLKENYPMKTPSRQEHLLFKCDIWSSLHSFFLLSLYFLPSSSLPFLPPSPYSSFISSHFHIVRRLTVGYCDNFFLNICDFHKVLFAFYSYPIITLLIQCETVRYTPNSVGFCFELPSG